MRFKWKIMECKGEVKKWGGIKENMMRDKIVKAEEITIIKATPKVTPTSLSWTETLQSAQP
jgi:hypothetical protein